MKCIPMLSARVTLGRKGEMKALRHLLRQKAKKQQFWFRPSPPDDQNREIRKKPA